MEGLDGVTRFWRARRVLVTGATGMIGAWLAKGLLAQGADVVALVWEADEQSELYREIAEKGLPERVFLTRELEREAAGL